VSIQGYAASPASCQLFLTLSIGADTKVYLGAALDFSFYFCTNSHQPGIEKSSFL